MEAWQVIVASLGGSTMLTLALAFLLREWISTRIKKSIENEYKVKQMELKAELDGKLEGTRAGYKKVLDENQIRFSRLHEDRANAIRELFKRLVNAEENIGDAFSPRHLTSDEKWTALRRAQAAFNEFCTFFTQNRIFLNDKDCELVEALRDTAKGAYIDFTTYDVSGVALDDASSMNRQELKRAARKTMVGEFLQLRLRLEQEFRTALGLVQTPP
jgi:hypothetical protein